MGRHAASRRLTFRLSRRRRGHLAILAAMGCVVSTWHISNSSFVSTTVNSGNTLQAGTVSVSNDKSAGQAFAVTGMLPGSTNSGSPDCVLVTFSGSVTSAVVLRTANYSTSDATSGAGQLGQLVTMTIRIGSGSSCAAFGSATDLFSGTLGDLGAKTTYATGVGGWTAAPGEARPYQIVYSLGDDNAGQGDRAGLDLVWEARST